MLAGLLYPTSGEARVLGHVPSRRESALLRRITMVMGNRNQLQWDLPALDSFDLIRAVYRLPGDEFRRTRDEFIDLLDLGSLVDKPIRNLSLGERMKMEIVGALLHRPTVLFLDEPTLGLDVTMQKRIRSFIAEYNRRLGASVLQPRSPATPRCRTAPNARLPEATVLPAIEVAPGWPPIGFVAPPTSSAGPERPAARLRPCP